MSSSDMSLTAGGSTSGDTPEEPILMQDLIDELVEECMKHPQQPSDYVRATDTMFDNMSQGKLPWNIRQIPPDPEFDYKSRLDHLTLFNNLLVNMERKQQQKLNELQDSVETPSQSSCSSSSSKSAPSALPSSQAVISASNTSEQAHYVTTTTSHSSKTYMSASAITTASDAPAYSHCRQNETMKNQSGSSNSIYFPIQQQRVSSSVKQEPVTSGQADPTYWTTPSITGYILPSSNACPSKSHSAPVVFPNRIPQSTGFYNNSPPEAPSETINILGSGLVEINVASSQIDLPNEDSSSTEPGDSDISNRGISNPSTPSPKPTNGGVSSGSFKSTLPVDVVACKSNCSSPDSRSSGSEDSACSAPNPKKLMRDRYLKNSPSSS